MRIEPSFSESDFLEDVTKAVPVFVVDGSHYRWAHKSLAEYFAAQYICNEGKRDQRSIFDAIREGGRIGSFSNVLDQIYDLDNIAFRVYLVSPLAKAFSVFWDSQYKGMNPSIPVSMINLRKSAAFGDKCLINVRSRAGASKDIKLFAAELLKEFESDDEIAIRIGFVRTDKQSMTIVNTPGPFAAILEILEEKKDPLVFDHTKKIQQFDEIKILSLKGLKKRNISLPVNDDPQNPLNSPNNFAAVTSIIVHHGPAVIDYDKMLSFARSCDAEPDKLQELGARLIQQMKEAAATAR